MFGTLLESKAPRQRRRVSTVASIVVHTAAIAGAIVATASAKTRAPRLADRPDSRMFYVPIPARKAEPIAPSRAELRTTRPISERLPDPGTIRYAPDSVVSPSTGIDSRTLLAADTAGLGLPQGPIGGELIRGRVAGDQPATAASVDRAAAMLAPPRPRYPDRLRAAGVTGRVVVRLVVDTTGRVEPASVVIREASHDLFAQAARAVLASLRFAPAEAGGRKVRMLVDLPFEFRLHE